MTNEICIFAAEELGTASPVVISTTDMKRIILRIKIYLSVDLVPLQAPKAPKLCLERGDYPDPFDGVSLGITIGENLRACLLF